MKINCGDYRVIQGGGIKGRLGVGINFKSGQWYPGLFYNNCEDKSLPHSLQMSLKVPEKFKGKVKVNFSLRNGVSMDIFDVDTSGTPPFIPQAPPSATSFLSLPPPPSSVRSMMRLPRAPFDGLRRLYTSESNGSTTDSETSTSPSIQGTPISMSLGRRRRDMMDVDMRQNERKVKDEDEMIKGERQRQRDEDLWETPSKQSPRKYANDPYVQNLIRQVEHYEKSRNYSYSSRPLPPHMYPPVPRSPPNGSTFSSPTISAHGSPMMSSRMPPVPMAMPPTPGAPFYHGSPQIIQFQPFPNPNTVGMPMQMQMPMTMPMPLQTLPLGGGMFLVPTNEMNLLRPLNMVPINSNHPPRAVRTAIMPQQSRVTVKTTTSPSVNSSDVLVSSVVIDESEL